MPIRKDIEEIQKIAQAKEGVCLSKRYINNKQKLFFKCREGHIFQKRLNDLKSYDSWCPFCAKVRKLTPEYVEQILKDLKEEEVSLSQKLPKSTTRNRLSIKDMCKLAQLNDGKCLSENYVNIMTPLKWECQKGHKFEAIPNDVKNSNTWCPYCSNKKVCDDNCLAIVYPDVAAEWHPTLNGELTPYEVAFGSSERVWWQCRFDKSHTWQTRVVGRLNRGCPRCWKGQKTSFPEQAIHFYLKQAMEDTENKFYHEAFKDKKQEIDIYIPSVQFAVEYDGRPFHDRKRQQENDEQKNYVLKEVGVELIRVRSDGLPIIQLHEALLLTHYYSQGRYYSSLDGVILEIFISLDLHLQKQYPSIYKKNKDIIRKVMQSISSYNDRLEILSQYRTNKKEKSLKVLFPEIAAEWHHTKNSVVGPEHISANSHKIVWWQCEQGHEWEAPVKQRKNGGRNCPICNSIFTTHPDIAAQWHPKLNKGALPYGITYGSDVQAWWICSCGYEWKEEIAKRTGRKDKGCPVCRNKILNQLSSLQSKYPEIAAEWHPTLNGDLTQNDVLPNSKESVYWMCRNNTEHVWKTSIAYRVNRKTTCIYCAGARTYFENGFASRYPKLMDEWCYEQNKGINPDDPFLKPMEKVWWRCKRKKNHIWDMPVWYRIRGEGCPYCAKKRVLPEESFAALHPKLLSELHSKLNEGVDPWQLAPKSGKKVTWQCTRDERHIWEMGINRRTHHGEGCPYCSKTRVLPEESFGNHYPHLAKQWHPKKNKRDSYGYTPNSKMVVWWFCEECNHEWEEAMVKRTTIKKQKPCCGK
ncbi:zinc-ribbon domain-containing protein [Bacillus tropicus]|uniref:zinc-ribbon domain-containing protein n=1 Tax=Bacillus tropicus TaxID=2026188 RepID=UPI003CFE59E8